MKKSLHTGHIGIEKTTIRARETLYWPNINGEIEDMIKSCSTCQEHPNQQSAEPMIPHDIPATPWQKVATDLFSLWKKDYIIVADYTSKFFDLSQLDDTNASTIVMHTKRIFSKFGIPKEVISDNGPQYTSQEYAKFAHDWDFEHITSSPEYPQSNGFIERTIQTVKKTLKKALHSGDDPYLALLALHTTPLSHDKPAPATILMNRQLRTTLPTVHNPTQPPSDPSKIKALENRQTNQPHRKLQPLAAGDSVRFRGKAAWDRKGVVLDKCKQPRSYHIVTDRGTAVRRNRRHLLHTKESIKPFEHFELMDFELEDHS